MPLRVKRVFPKDTLGHLSKFIVPEVQKHEPLRIGLLNLMPNAARAATERQFISLVGQATKEVEPVLIRLEWIPKRGADRMEKYYNRFQDVKHEGLDGLIISGANLELVPGGGALLPFEEFLHYNELRELVDWARDNVSSTLFSCLATHFALKQHYGLERELGSAHFGPLKSFGVFEHTVHHAAAGDSGLLDDINDRVFAPHSRWGNVTADLVEQVQEIQLAMTNDMIGWHMGIGRGGREVYLQGHPEYDRMDLHSEYQRDKENGQPMPFNYYPADNDTKMPLMNWKADGNILFRNWVQWIFNYRAAGKKLN